MNMRVGNGDTAGMVGAGGGYRGSQGFIGVVAFCVCVVGGMGGEGLHGPGG